MPHGPLRPNATSSIKLEVHSISRYCEMITGPMGVMYKEFGEHQSRCSRDIHVDRQTDGHEEEEGFELTARSVAWELIPLWYFEPAKVVRPN